MDKDRNGVNLRVITAALAPRPVLGPWIFRKFLSA